MKNGKSFDRASQRLADAVRIVLGLTASATLMSGALAAEDSDTLEEVIVTAQFREQNVQQTPLAITAISGDMLESRSQTSIAEVANQAPNVTLKSQGAAFGPSLAASIRGVGQYDFNPALEPGVGLYVDDVYFATLTGSILDLLDLDRVEVLRGPQGTLAGRNSIGGAVKLYSKKPRGSGGYISGTYGSRDRTDFRGSADFELASNVFARLSGVSKQQRGYIERRDYGCDHPGSGVPILTSVGQNCVIDREGDVNYQALRGQLRWVASDNLEIGAAVDYTHDDRNPAGSVIAQGSTTVNPNTQPVPGITSLSPSAFVPPPGSYYNYASYYNVGGTFRVLAGPNAGTVLPAAETRAEPRVRFNGWGGSVNVDWEISDELSLKSISAYREYDTYFANDNDLSPLASSLGYSSLTFHSFSEELRLNGSLLENRIEYTLGGFYMEQKSVYATTQDLRFLPTSLNANIQSGHADFGVVPIENSTEGIVTNTLDVLLTSSLRVCGEVELRIRQNLMGCMPSLEHIERICSHQQSLAQCHK